MKNMKNKGEIHNNTKMSKKRLEEVHGFLCPNCESFHPYEDEAKECCEEDAD